MNKNLLFHFTKYWRNIKYYQIQKIETVTRTTNFFQYGYKKKLTKKFFFHLAFLGKNL